MHDRIAWVFGVTGLMGRAIAQELARTNTRVVGFSRTKLKHPDDPITQIENLEIVVCDLTLLDSIKTILEEAGRKFGNPNSIYFCARGKVITNQMILEENCKDNSLNDYLISVYSPILISLFALDAFTHLRDIVFLSSQYSLVGQKPELYEDASKALSALYSSNKGAVISGARSLAILGAKKGVHVNVFSLGGLAESTSPSLQKTIESEIPTGRMMNAAAVAESIVKITALSRTGLVGSNIVIDMGWTIQ